MACSTGSRPTAHQNEDDASIWMVVLGSALGNKPMIHGSSVLMVTHCFELVEFAVLRFFFWRLVVLSQELALTSERVGSLRGPFAMNLVRLQMACSVLSEFSANALI